MTKDVVKIVSDISFFVIMVAVTTASASAFFSDPINAWSFEYWNGGIPIRIPAWVDFLMTATVSAIVIAKLVAHWKDAALWHDVESSFRAGDDGKVSITMDSKKYECVDTNIGKVCKISNG